MTELLARAVGVTRRYGDTVALDTVDLDVPAGELVGLLGPNGAGKTTLMQLLVGLRRPHGGHVELFGGDPTEPSNRRELGMTPQETGLPATLRVGEVVDFVARHFPDPDAPAAVLERFGLAAMQGKQTGALSGGQKRRLAVALAFIGRPRLVVLDEPTTGLDVESRHELWNLVREYHAAGGTVLLTSHYLEEIEALAKRVVVLDRGKIIADGDMASVRGMVTQSRVSLRAPALPDLSGITSIARDGDSFELQTTNADQLIRELVRSDVAFSHLQVRPASLEEAFLALTNEPATSGRPS